MRKSQSSDTKCYSADIQEMFHEAIREIIMLLYAQIASTDEIEGQAPSEAYVCD